MLKQFANMFFSYYIVPSGITSALNMVVQFSTSFSIIILNSSKSIVPSPFISTSFITSYHTPSSFDRLFPRIAATSSASMVPLPSLSKSVNAALRF